MPPLRKMQMLPTSRTRRRATSWQMLSQQRTGTRCLPVWNSAETGPKTWSMWQRASWVIRRASGTSRRSTQTTAMPMTCTAGPVTVPGTANLTASGMPCSCPSACSMPAFRATRFPMTVIRPDGRIPCAPGSSFASWKKTIPPSPATSSSLTGTGTVGRTASASSLK